MIDLAFIQGLTNKFTILSKEGSEMCPSFFLGCDEVGRGPLAGPVCAVTVCACLPQPYTKSLEHFEQALLQLQAIGVTDSKKINAKKRQKILNEIGIVIDVPKNENQIFYINWQNIDWVISGSSKSHIVIDQVNILKAAMQAMEESIIVSTKDQVDHGLGWIDGNKLPYNANPKLDLKAQVKGDSSVLLVALASIIAKEWRDQWMNLLALEFPLYGLEENAGYPTKKHLEALVEYGPSVIHRKSFKGVIQTNI